MLKRRNTDEVMRIINNQGAQVTNLEQRVNEQSTIITLLVSRLVEGKQQITFSPDDFEQAKDIKGVGWNQLKDGTLKVKVKR